MILLMLKTFLFVTIYLLKIYGLPTLETHAVRQYKTNDGNTYATTKTKTSLHSILSILLKNSMSI